MTDTPNNINVDKEFTKIFLITLALSIGTLVGASGFAIFIVWLFASFDWAGPVVTLIFFAFFAVFWLFTGYYDSVKRWVIKNRKNSKMHPNDGGWRFHVEEFETND